jgi:hypothetical protein
MGTNLIMRRQPPVRRLTCRSSEMAIRVIVNRLVPSHIVYQAAAERQTSAIGTSSFLDPSEL